jgi:periplasmic protein TonB
MEFTACYISLSNAAPVLKQSFITSKPYIMNSEDISKSDVLDILFENRNKQYGAYDLRKFYHLRLYKALGAMLALVAVFAAFSFMAPRKTKAPDEVVGSILTTVQAQIKEKEPEKPKEQPKPQAQPHAQQVFTPRIQIVPASDVVDTIRDIVDTIDFGGTNTPDLPGSGSSTVGSTPGSGGGSGGNGPGPVPTPEPEPVFNPEEPVDNPEVEPQFPGGIQRLRAFLQRNLSNPRDMEDGERIKVVMKFVVGYDGKLKAFETVQDGGEEFNKEVLRVLKKMPDWVPGKSNGRNVSVYFSLPVIFEAAQ